MASLPNSPDLNQVDYKTWGCVQERVYQKLVLLKQRLVEVWSDVQQTVVDAAIGEWRKRLRACVVRRHIILNICSNFLRCL